MNARGKGWTGVTTLASIVDEDWRVVQGSARVARSSGHPETDAAAMNAVRGMGQMPPPPKRADVPIAVNFREGKGPGRWCVTCRASGRDDVPFGHFRAPTAGRLLAGVGRGLRAGSRRGSRAVLRRCCGRWARGLRLDLFMGLTLLLDIGLGRGTIPHGVGMGSAFGLV
ncbi:MAG: energy transducer TonB [Desulfovibrio sp.]|nr:energy transducer TonB [Desulfovibrio sp.]